MERDAEKDLAMCEAATPGKWEGRHAIQPYITVFNGVSEEVIATTYTWKDMHFIVEARIALPHWIKRAVAAEEREKKLVAALQLIAEESEDIISVDCAWDALRAYDEVKVESEGLGKGKCELSKKNRGGSSHE